MALPLARGSISASLALLLVVACRGSVPGPRIAQQPTSAYDEVPSLPPAGRVEIVPPSPQRGAVWIDGQWMGVQRGRWVWQTGGWVSPPPGASFSPWTATRREDGRLFFAAPAWRTAKGESVPAPPFLAKAEHGEPAAHTNNAAEEDAPVASGRAAPDAGVLENPPPLMQDAGPPPPPTLNPETPLPGAKDAGAPPH